MGDVRLLFSEGTTALPPESREEGGYERKRSSRRAKGDRSRSAIKVGLAVKGCPPGQKILRKEV